jgi:hypothetical protein
VIGDEPSPLKVRCGYATRLGSATRSVHTSGLNSIPKAHLYFTLKTASYEQPLVVRVTGPFDSKDVQIDGQRFFLSLSLPIRQRAHKPLDSSTVSIAKFTPHSALSSNHSSKK